MVNDRSQNGTPDTYTAKTSITFEDGFESLASDDFETVIDSGATPCDIAGQTLAVKDMGNDGSINSLVAKDAYSFGLHYYNEAGLHDYAPIGQTQPLAGATPPGFGFTSLYNGNIAAMSVNVPKIGQALLYSYQYDQLNRLVSMDAYKGLNPQTNSWEPVAINDYKENISYDANGNVQTALRNGSSSQLSLENFNYNYDPTDKNRLLSIHNSVNSQTYNYTYNEIGETTKDDLAGNASMEWNVYGKLARVVKTDSTKIDFTYDAAGNRISKTVSGANGYTEWYVNDASGNAMAVYRIANGSSELKLTQQDIYGSSRLAVYNRDIDADAAPPEGTAANLIGKYYISFYNRGNKNYYFGNHLGNTLLTTSDKKSGHSSDGINIDYYTADIVSATDYSPFGVNLMDRSMNSQSILYGFNGKWNDFETGYENYGMRMYSGKDKRFKSVDPLTRKYPELTPYQFASNRPIDGIDLDGTEYLPTFPRFQNSGNRTLSDYAGGIDNAVIDILNLIPSTWNAGVNTVKSVVGGTFTKDFKNELAGVGGALKELGTNLATKPITTLTSPEAVNFAASGYIGAKAFTIVGNAKNLLTPGTSTTVEETVTVYRGVNESHVDFAGQSKGIVKPNGGNATALEHNIGSTLNSPFTSWTTNPEVAENFALRPSGSGVVLKKNVPVKEMTPSPNRKEVLLKNTNKRVSESEVLLKGKVKVPKRDIKKVSN